MLANGAKETTTTTGTGTVTLSAVTGFPRFAQAFGVGELVQYGIKDGDSWEWGLGTVGASNTLARTRVLATYASGAYNDSTPAKLNLSGAAEVFCTYEAGTGVATMPSVWSSSVVANAAFPFVNNDGSLQLVANRLYLIPFLYPVSRPITSLICGVQTAVASTKIRMGVYGLNAAGEPSALLTQSGDIASTTTGYKESAITPLRLHPGWHYVAIVSNGTPSVRANTWEMQQLTPLGAEKTQWLNYRAYAIATLDPGWTDLPSTAPGWASQQIIAVPRVAVGVN